jgi:nitroimidazol reductase NimA-like FMN-containing flavoprotein (pyridoxamine 5'-phosphate oxidase superfamily)
MEPFEVEDSGEETDTTEGDHPMPAETPDARDHAGMVVLTSDECDDLLASTAVGRVAFVSDGDPVILPVNYRYHEGSIVFRTESGAKLDAAASRTPVAFEIDGWDVDSHTGWSVLVKGVATAVDEDDEAEELFGLGLLPWTHALDKRRWVRIRPEEVSGRKVV